MRYRLCRLLLSRHSRVLLSHIRSPPTFAAPIRLGVVSTRVGVVSWSSHRIGGGSHKIGGGHDRTEKLRREAHRGSEVSLLLQLEDAECAEPYVWPSRTGTHGAAATAAAAAAAAAVHAGGARLQSASPGATARTPPRRSWMHAGPCSLSESRRSSSAAQELPGAGAPTRRRRGRLH